LRVVNRLEAVMQSLLGKTLGQIAQILSRYCRQLPAGTPTVPDERN
jgi:hypothetical protein